MALEAHLLVLCRSRLALVWLLLFGLTNAAVDISAERGSDREGYVWIVTLAVRIACILVSSMLDVQQDIKAP